RGGVGARRRGGGGGLRGAGGARGGAGGGVHRRHPPLAPLAGGDVAADQIDQHSRLGTQDLRHNRLGQVIDRAQRVATEELGIRAFVGRQKDNGRVPGFLPLADERGRF